jgi:hypothetical protein
MTRHKHNNERYGEAMSGGGLGWKRLGPLARTHKRKHANRFRGECKATVYWLFLGQQLSHKE